MNNIELVEDFLSKKNLDGIDKFLLEKYMDAIKSVLEENKLLKRQNKIKNEYCSLIWNLGIDYDGLNTVESLKDLIGELVDYAIKAQTNNDKTVEYEGGNNEKYNILREKIDEPRKSD